MKTLREWIYFLEQDELYNYLSEIYTQGKSYRLEEECYSLKDAIFKGFHWRSSKNGDAYWADLAFKYEYFKPSFPLNHTVLAIYCPKNNVNKLKFYIK